MHPEILPRTTHAGKVRELYSRLSGVYDFFTDHEILHHKAAVRLARVRAEDLVLEVACGTGRGALEIIKQRGKAGRLYALDLTVGMIDRAKAKVARAGLTQAVHFVAGDAQALPFKDNCFHVLYNAYMFDLIETEHFLPILAEFQRVLKSGGRIVLVNMSKNTPRRTFYELLYEKGFLGSLSGGCRPVALKPFLLKAGFGKVARLYRRNWSWFFMNWLTGTEIVLGYKS